MSDERSRIKNSARRHDDETAVSRQLRILRSKLGHTKSPDTENPHRLAKRHAMDCGNPGCVMCGNPRKLWGELTPQERRLFQDMDEPSHHRGNGLDRDK